MPAKTERPPAFLFEPGDRFVGDFFIRLRPAPVGKTLRRGRSRCRNESPAKAAPADRAPIAVACSPSVRFTSYPIFIVCSCVLRGLARLDDKQRAAVFDQFAVLGADLHDTTGNLGIDGREQLHHLDQAKRMRRRRRRADVDESPRAPDWARDRRFRPLGPRPRFDRRRRRGCDFGAAARASRARQRKQQPAQEPTFDVLGRRARRGAIPAHNEFDIAGFDNEFVAGTAVDQLQDFGDLIVCSGSRVLLSGRIASHFIDGCRQSVGRSLQKRNMLQTLLQRHARQWRRNCERRDPLSARRAHRHGNTHYACQKFLIVDRNLGFPDLLELCLQLRGTSVMVFSV